MRTGIAQHLIRSSPTRANSLLSDLRSRLGGPADHRICLMGIGNAARRDDGFGVRLAEAMAALGWPHVIQAGTTPERFMGAVLEQDADRVLLLDAVDFGAVPGTVVLLNAQEMEHRFPQISTHRISLGLLARYLEANSSRRAWLLGVQPESLHPALDLSPLLQTTLETLVAVLRELLGLAAGKSPERGGVLC
jgi:hydrogenase maturation protease